MSCFNSTRCWRWRHCACPTRRIPRRRLAQNPPPCASLPWAACQNLDLSPRITWSWVRLLAPPLRQLHTHSAAPHSHDARLDRHACSCKHLGFKVRVPQEYILRACARTHARTPPPCPLPPVSLAGSHACLHSSALPSHEAALMEMALVQWSMHRLVQRGFTPVLGPDLVHHQMVEGCGFHPRGESSQVYAVANSNLCLVGTAEIPCAGMLTGKLMDAEVQCNAHRVAAYASRAHGRRCPSSSPRLDTASAPRRARAVQTRAGCTACTSSARWRCSHLRLPRRANACWR